MINNSITVQHLEKLFNQFNDKFFNGELPAIPIEIKRTRGRIGTFEYSWRRVGKTKIYSPIRIIISNYFNYPLHDIEETLIHEMIHYYICYKNIKDNNMHGRKFMALAYRISQIDSNYNVTKTYERDTEELELTHTPTNCTYYFLTYDYEGEQYFTRTSKNLIDRIVAKNNVCANPKITNVTCYSTTDPNMSRYTQRSSRFSTEPISYLSKISNITKIQ